MQGGIEAQIDSRAIYATIKLQYGIIRVNKVSSYKCLGISGEIYKPLLLLIFFADRYINITYDLDDIWKQVIPSHIKQSKQSEFNGKTKQKLYQMK